MKFRIRGLDAGQFSHLFALSDAQLAAQGALRKIVDGPCPCRVSLTDAMPGDEVILVNYEHHFDKFNHPNRSKASKNFTGDDCPCRHLAKPTP
jgi:hypothetical protein